MDEQEAIRKAVLAQLDRHEATSDKCEQRAREVAEAGRPKFQPHRFYPDEQVGTRCQECEGAGMRVGGRSCEGRPFLSGGVPPMESVRRAMLEGQARAERSAYSEPPGEMVGLAAMLPPPMSSTPAAMLGEALGHVRQALAVLASAGLHGVGAGPLRLEVVVGDLRNTERNLTAEIEAAKREADAREGR